MSTGPPRTPPDHRPLVEAPIGVVPLLWDLRDATAAHVLAEVGRLGFAGVQWRPDLAADPRANDVHVAEIYAAVRCDPDGPVAGTAERLRLHLESLDNLGGDVLVVACDGDARRDRWAGRATAPDAPRLSPWGWRRLADAVEQVAGQAAGLGRTVAFHAHAGTWVETPGELDTLMAQIGRDDVGICLDTGHHLLGGGDPVVTVERYADRITHVHVKDVATAPHDDLRRGRLDGLYHAIERRVFCTLGSGVLDLSAVLAALDRTGYDGWLMIEQDSAWEPAAEATAISRRVLDFALRHLT